MADNEWNHYGGRNDSEEQRKQFAIESLQHCSNDAQFGELFPEVKQEIDEKIKLEEDVKVIQDSEDQVEQGCETKSEKNV